MPDLNPYKVVDKPIVRDAISVVTEHLTSSRFILIHGPRKCGKTTALSVIYDWAEHNSYHIIAENKLLSQMTTENDSLSSLPEVDKLLILFDGLDRYPGMIAKLNKLSKASVIATVQGRYRPAGGPWDGWERVPIGPLSDKEVGKFLDTSFDALSAEKDHRQKIIEGVLYLSNGHPFFVHMALDLLNRHWNEFKSKDKWENQDFREFICSCQEADKETLINRISQYLQNFRDDAKMMLALIAIEFGYVVDPYDQERTSSRTNRNWLHRLLSGIRRARSRLTRTLECSVPRPLLSSPLTTDALMVTHDAQDWLSGPLQMIDLLKALDELEDEGVVNYDASGGWQITPMVGLFFRLRGWAAIKDLGVEEHFRR